MNVDRSTLSPMMQQYFDVKDKYPGHIVFFRLGDFYEMFFDDAVVVSKALELTLTGRDCGQEERAPMCGIPYHSAEIYIKKLIDLGYRVAICEQMEDPKLVKGLVKRDVIRIVTPGTLTESNLLDDSKNNFIAALYVNGGAASICFADISTGTAELFIYKDRSETELSEAIINEISRFAPAELLVNTEAKKLSQVIDFIRTRMELTETVLEDDKFDRSLHLGTLLAQFSAESLSDMNVDENDDCSVAALCGLFYYISDTQRAAVGRFTELVTCSDKRFMEIDLTARRNLELTETLRNKERRGSLIWVLDRTRTSMGKRLLKSYIEQPLLKPAAIIDRLDAVEELYNDPVMQGELGDALEGVYDLERLMTRVVYKTATPRDVKALAKTAEQMPLIKSLIANCRTALLKGLEGRIHELKEIAALVDNAISDDPPQAVKDGGVIKDGFNPELDRLRGIIKNGRSIIDDIENREKEKTGIKNLKIGYNRVFGYYIEVTKSYYDLVPAEYIRKQTLANCERFITDELKKAEEEISGASEKTLVMEAEIFAEVRDFIGSRLTEVQETAQAAAALDVLCSFAEVSMRNRYVKPDIVLDGTLDIKGGRHPVVEQMITGEMYVPNDVYLDTDSRRMAIITGPNMAGKSTFMRQTALIVLMAQIGCFVPADSARISIADRIFTRVGASDDLTAGQSTFMVEMSEVAEILKHATRQSLVILDEVGRGTSTFDGISIATAVAEYIANKKKIGCKTLFATHYHELIGLEGRVEGVKNYSVAVKKYGESIKFLRKIVEGGVDDSYGIEVAKLAGLPKGVVARAKELLADMEAEKYASGAAPVKKEEEQQISFGSMKEEQVLSRLRKTNPDEYSPRDAMLLLQELCDMLN
ncbi:MAG: DNA mismatch repair protein MutS [Oscillospiraceae bacterium]|nr:DNA mismatch repair protein MutS [Oscillospiraceae bacterium]MDY2863085.1 DNA mismatch repair protein MutS [Oscillospiraceae bacterium]